MMSFLKSLVRPVAYLSLPVILLRSIAASSPAGRYYVRVFVYLGTLATVATCSIAVAAGMSIIGRRFDVNYIVARVFYNLAKRLLDLEVVVEGEEHLNLRPAVLMANHQSELDILIVGKLMPTSTSIMSKKSLQFTPVGPFMTMSGAIFIDRGNNARAVRSLEAAGETMRRRKISMWIFPEGTRYKAEVPDMLPLKKGGFHLAIQAGLPIIPIVTENYWRMYHRGVFDSGKIRVRVLPPISTEGLTPADVPALAVRVREQMLEALRDISAKVPSSQQSKNVESKPISPDTKVSPATSADVKSEPTVTPAPAAQAVLEPTGGSSSSLSSSIIDGTASDHGTETSTEEDEGMVLVGRPP